MSNSDTDSDGDGFPDEVEAGLGTSSSSSTSTPFGGAQAGTVEALTVLRAIVKLNFTTTGKDMILVKGELPVPAGFVVNGIVVAVDVGGEVKQFTLDEKGRSPKADDSFKVKVKSRKGVVEAQISKFIAKFKRGSFSNEFSDEGLLGTRSVKKVSRTVPIIILFNQTMYRTDRAVLYTARENKKGVAK